jgi:hypothetical protein
MSVSSGHARSSKSGPSKRREAGLAGVLLPTAARRARHGTRRLAVVAKDIPQLFSEEL